MAKNVLLIALVLSKWLIADTKTEKPSFYDLLSDGKPCADWPIGSLFPDFCAFALYRCITKKYYLQTFRCPGVIIQRTATKSPAHETVIEASISENVEPTEAETHTTTTPQSTINPQSTTLPVVLAAVVASTGDKESVSLELFHSTTMNKTTSATTTTTEETSTEETTTEEVVSTTGTEHPQENVNVKVQVQEHIQDNVKEHPKEHPQEHDKDHDQDHPTVVHESSPEHSVSTDGEVTAEPVSVQISESFGSEAPTGNQHSTTTKFPFQPIAISRSVGSFSKFFTLYLPVTTKSSSLDLSANEGENHPNPPKQKLIAGRVEAKVSLVTLNGHTSSGTNAPHNLRENNTDLFVRLQDNEVQRLIQQTQGLLAKGKGKELQATSLQLLKALNLANAQNAANFGMRFKAQRIANWAQP